MNEQINKRIYECMHTHREWGERRDHMLLETCASYITEFLELCFPAPESSGGLTNWPVILRAGHLLLLNTHSLATDTQVAPSSQLPCR